MIESIVAKLKEEREKAGITTDELNDKLRLGPGWIEGFEANQTAPTIDFIFAIVRALDLDFETVFQELDFSSAKDVLSHNIEVEDAKKAKQKGANVRFRYNSYLAEVFIPSASKATFDVVVEKFRDDLRA